MKIKEFLKNNFRIILFITRQLFSLNSCLSTKLRAQRVTHYCVRYASSREAWSSLQSFGRKWQIFRNRQTIDRTCRSRRYPALMKSRSKVATILQQSVSYGIVWRWRWNVTERISGSCAVYIVSASKAVYTLVILAISILYCYGKPYRCRV